jgi:hypothetical protein
MDQLVPEADIIIPAVDDLAYSVLVFVQREGMESPLSYVYRRGQWDG